MVICPKCKEHVINLFSNGLCKRCYQRTRYPIYLESLKNKNNDRIKNKYEKNVSLKRDLDLKSYREYKRQKKDLMKIAVKSMGKIPTINTKAGSDSTEDSNLKKEFVYGCIKNKMDPYCNLCKQKTSWLNMYDEHYCMECWLNRQEEIEKFGKLPTLVFEIIEKSKKCPIVKLRNEEKLCQSCHTNKRERPYGIYCPECMERRNIERKERQRDKGIRNRKKRMRLLKSKKNSRLRTQSKEDDSKKVFIKSTVKKLLRANCAMCNQKVPWTALYNDKYCESCWINRQDEIKSRLDNE